MPVFTAIGVQIYINMNIKRSTQLLTNTGTSDVDDPVDTTFISPWDMIIIGKKVTQIKTELLCPLRRREGYIDMHMSVGRSVDKPCPINS